MKNDNVEILARIRGVPAKSGGDENDPSNPNVRKPFKGVISQWRREDDRVVGLCLYHEDADEELWIGAILDNRIVRGHVMRTSAVVSIEDRGTFSLCETANSIYALVRPDQQSQQGSRGRLLADYDRLIADYEEAIPLAGATFGMWVSPMDGKLILAALKTARETAEKF